MSTMINAPANAPANTPADLYWQYLTSHCPNLEREGLTDLAANLEKTAWDAPETSLDWNNVGVMALIEAEQAADPALRAMGLDLAMEALTQGSEMQPVHPLCIAHLALIRNLIGEPNVALQMAFPTLINLLQYSYNAPEALPTGLVYLPLQTPKGRAANQELIYHLLHAEEGYIQALRLTAEVLSQINLMPYNLGGLRFLQLAAQAIPDAASLHLKLGLANLQGQQWEGLLYLQQARTLAPSFAPIIQALYLAYRTLEPEVAAYWLQYGQDCAQDAPHAPAWAWTQLSLESPFTYVPFDQLLLAVDPSLDSIVTSVLLGEGDWFETEMEFWRRQLQPGMTVIDVGANVGVYTFSGAQRVGPTGKVLAVEPFSGCARCLQETRRLNQFDWVKICVGAASDRHGTAHLALQASSELNEIVSDATVQSNQEVEEILCFPLDSLIEQEGLTRVDWLKIDAEGHEMQVLAGSERLLAEFAPGILYENISALQKSNTDVAEYLLSKGYKLFRYQSFLGNLIPLESLDQLKSNLNIIALPAS